LPWCHSCSSALGPFRGPEFVALESVAQTAVGSSCQGTLWFDCGNVRVTPQSRNMSFGRVHLVSGWNTAAGTLSLSLSLNQNTNQLSGERRERHLLMHRC